ncbi:AI-2E family transporter [Chlorobium phaeobacteroides]|jgi:predicted PurR-regulated permease PerM|uniref:AI-2E family transporter n=1 Tax=Chlorobium phaeobacteroides (strain DSM 266 / SMG 266 / 2430) TaxID=290317 RepID=A1BIY0_CHLPD|nr:AI-2E family transporter [Chlorobium phaeobacteroides]ABL66357.1 protein of unknown function UPF0118 [Chlorobium phaeobacteroides DSM 266]MBV5320033.1 AI-2E family transporter [Chlorobium phaeobacteroides]
MDTRQSNRTILLVIVLFISAVFIAMIRYFLMALLMAAIFSALLMPLYHRFERWFQGNKSLSAGVTILALVLMVLLPSLALIGMVLAQALRLSRLAAPWVQQQIHEPGAFSRTLETLPYYHELEVYREDILKKIGEFAGTAGNMLLGAISSFTLSAVNELFLLFFFLYTMFFFLKDGREILDKMLSYLPLTEGVKSRLLEKFLSVTRATLKGSVVVGLVQGTLAGLALHLAGIDSALFWGAIMTLLSFIPVLGSPLVWVPAVIYLLLIGQYPQALGVLLFCSIIVGQIDNILRPILIGRDTKMNELMIFLGTLGGLGLFGIIGIIVGPIVAALFVTVWEIYGEAFSDYLDEVRGNKEV